MNTCKGSGVRCYGRVAGGETALSKDELNASGMLQRPEIPMTRAAQTVARTAVRTAIRTMSVPSGIAHLEGFGLAPATAAAVGAVAPAPAALATAVPVAAAAPAAPAGGSWPPFFPCTDSKGVCFLFASDYRGTGREERAGALSLWRRDR